MFYVIEVQKNSEGNYAHLVHTAETIRQAESTFYSVAASAAISGLPLHSIVMFNEDGHNFVCKTYKPEVEPEPEE